MLLDYDLVSIEDYSVRVSIQREFYERIVRETEPSAEEIAELEKFPDKKRANVPIRRFKNYLIQ